MIITDFYPNFRLEILNEKRKELLQKIKIKSRIEKMSPEELIKDAKKKNDTAEVVDYKIAEDGSLRMYMRDWPVPYRGIGDSTATNITAIYKRFLPAVADSLSKQNVFQKIITLLAIRFNLKIFPNWIEYVFQIFPVLLEEERWSEPVKEIRRVLSKNEIYSVWINAISLVLEYDNAYRFRFQDIIVLLNKAKLNKRTELIKEISRLLDILSEREEAQCHYAGKYNQIKKLLKLIIFFMKKKPFRKLQSVLMDFNLERLKLTEEDLYYTNRWGVYSYGGLLREERKQASILKYGE